MGDLKRRLERLERGRKPGLAVIFVKPGETKEEAWQKHLAEHPDHEKAEDQIYIINAIPRTFKNKITISTPSALIGKPG